MAKKKGAERQIIPFTGSRICSECDQLVEEGEEIFMDAVGILQSSKGVLEVEDICIYHRKCILE